MDVAILTSGRDTISLSFYDITDTFVLVQLKLKQRYSFVAYRNEKQYLAKKNILKITFIRFPNVWRNVKDDRRMNSISLESTCTICRQNNSTFQHFPCIFKRFTFKTVNNKDYY